MIGSLSARVSLPAKGASIAEAHSTLAVLPLSVLAQVLTRVAKALDSRLPLVRVGEAMYASASFRHLAVKPDWPSISFQQRPRSAVLAHSWRSSSASSPADSAAVAGGGKLARLAYARLRAVEA